MLWPVFALSLLRGVAHGFEADHLATVAMLHGHEATTNPSKHSSQNRFAKFFITPLVVRAVIWSLGHGVMLLLASVVLWYLLQQWQWGADGMAMLGARFDMIVGIAMVGLAVYYIIGMLRIHVHHHRHDNVAHVHLHSHRQFIHHRHRHRPGRAVFALGLLHGLAGSADVMVLGLLSTSNNLAQGLLALLVFSVGVVAGIVFLSLVISHPLQWVAQHLAVVYRWVALASCFVAIGIGASLIHHGW